MARRAQRCIAQGALTNSKRPDCFVKGVYPTHVKRGQGCWLWDHRGNRYLDFITGLGTNLLGYAQTTINAAISEQMGLGASHSLSTHVEIETAETLKALFPFVDAVKFLKTGSEACSAAIRIARGKTGQNIVLSEGYHGWSDEFVSLTPPAIGIPPQDCIGKYSEREHWLEQGEVAAVIIEPVITDWSDNRRAYLQNLRELCTKHGVMLIFDEIITGFRFPKYSVSSFWGITPDLIVLGKGMANGMPLAAVGGKFDVMNGSDYFVSSTYAGETLSLAAAKKSMELLQSPKFDLNWLWGQGQAFLDEFNAIYPEKIRIEGYPTRGAFVGDPLVRALFFQEACLAGMLFGASWWMNFPAANEWRPAMGAIKAILGRIQRGEISLKGEMPKAPFAQKAREKVASAFTGTGDLYDPQMGEMRR